MNYAIADLPAADLADRILKLSLEVYKLEDDLSRLADAERTEPLEQKLDELDEMLAQIHVEFGRRGGSDWRVLIPLLRNQNPWARLNAAATLLYHDAGKAIPVLEELMELPWRDGPEGWIDFNAVHVSGIAEMNLNQYRFGSPLPRSMAQQGDAQ